MRVHSGCNRREHELEAAQTPLDGEPSNKGGPSSRGLLLSSEQEQAANTQHRLGFGAPLGLQPVSGSCALWEALCETSCTRQKLRRWKRARGCGAAGGRSEWEARALGSALGGGGDQLCIWAARRLQEPTWDNDA